MKDKQTQWGIDTKTEQVVAELVRIFDDHYVEDLQKLQGLELVYGFPVEIVHLAMLFEDVTSDMENRRLQVTITEQYQYGRPVTKAEWQKAFMTFAQEVGVTAVFQEEDVLKMTRLVIMDRSKKKTFACGAAYRNTLQELYASNIVANRLGSTNLLEMRSRQQNVAKALTDLMCNVGPEQWRIVDPI